MPRKLALCTLALLLFIGFHAAPAVAQDDDGPGTRVVTVSSFHLPFGPDRGKVLDWMADYFHPFSLLNPNVLNYRVLFHNWGANAMDVVLVSEYAEFEDIQADCGQPCDDWAEAHPNPEEGDEGYEEFQEAVQLFNKYYAKHRDEIYVIPMEEAKVEGRVMGTVGHEPDEDDDN